MSIRLRLTLLYSAILTLTLLIFGVALYSIQAQDTISSLQRDLMSGSERLSEAALRINSEPHSEDRGRHESSPPQSFDEFPDEKAFDELREREIVRILDAEGNLIISPFGRNEDALPLSEEGLSALLDQQDWWSDETISNEHMLIYNHPLVKHGETIYILQVARSLTERDRTLRSLAITLGGAGLATILIAFGAGWALSGISLRPIHRITQTAQAIGDERDFSRRVDYAGPQDEVGRLANTFNQMLSQLQDAYQKVGHALQMQRNFVTDVSHELRTPLTTLRGNLGLLHHIPPAPPEEQADILSDMVDESDRLIRLVNDLLLLAHADSGRRLAVEQVEMLPIIMETVRQARVLDPRHEIVMDVPIGLYFRGDGDAFKQVMLILLDNALKHSDGEIHIHAEAVGQRVEILVKDRGGGILPETLEHIFDRFYRGEENLTTPGFGLGLPIAKTLVESMEGTISIESELGVGSVVRLSFLIIDWI